MTSRAPHARPLRARYGRSVAFLATGGFLVLLGCDCDSQTFPPSQADRVGIAQGAWGRVWIWGPLPTPNASGCQVNQEIVPASRTVLFYGLASDGDVEGARWSEGDVPVFGVHYDDVSTELVDSVTSDEFGFFEATLPAGRYSVLVRSGQALLWPDGVLGAASINPLEVPEGGTVEVPININSLVSLPL